MASESPPINCDPAVALWKMWFHMQHLENIDEVIDMEYII